MPQHRRSQIQNILRNNKIPALNRSIYLCSVHNSNRSTGRSPQIQPAAISCRPDNIHYKRLYFIIHAHLFDFLPECRQFRHRKNRFFLSPLLYDSFMMQIQHCNLILSFRIIHQYLKHKTVQLSFRQTISTLMFHRILSSNHNKRKFHLIFQPVTGNLPFFHHLKEQPASWPANG